MIHNDYCKHCVHYNNTTGNGLPCIWCSSLDRVAGQTPKFFVRAESVWAEFQTEPGQESEHDTINHPSHYTAGRKYEPIDVIEDWQLPMHLGNAVKYISRAGRKGDAREDIEKAVWYLRRYLDKVLPEGDGK
jgi:hypothetical protein